MPRIHRLASTLTAIGFAVAALPLSLGAQAAQSVAAGPRLSPELMAARTALDKYQDPVMAVRDGFLSSLGCLTYSAGMSGHGGMDYKAGGMGVHFINMCNIGPTLDPMKPQVLIYEPAGDKLRLVAAEWFVPTAVSKTAPSIFGQTLGGPMAGHEPLLPAELHHWDLHVWLWKDNPSGVFSPTNPAVSCPATGYSFVEKPPAMAHD
jgi:hypothetical protein